jgi:ammonia channel protein AmtB
MPDDKLSRNSRVRVVILLWSLTGYLLICKKDDEQEIKQYVNDIKIKKGDYLLIKKSAKLMALFSLYFKYLFLKLP